ncbi:MAG: PAS domain-containing protein [Gemmatimonadota bacterium]
MTGALRAAWLDEATNKGSVSMDVCPHVRYRIDRDDRIAEVNDAWPKFATENEGDGLEPSRILSRSIWDFLADDTTIQLYKSMIRQSREGGLPVRFRFRCDSPDRRRLLAMEITSNLEGDVMFTVRSAVEQSRPYVSLLGHADLHSGGFLVMCAWCKHIPLSTDRWVEAEEAVDALGLFSGSPLPALTHGICPSCFNALEQLLQDRELAAAGTVTCGALKVT